MKKIKKILGAVVVIAVTLAFVLPSSAVVTNIENTKETKELIFNNAKKVSLELNKIDPIIKTSNFAGNVLLSINSPEDDILPDITVDGNGIIIVTYSHELSVFEAYPVVLYSEDNGINWDGWLFNGMEGFCTYPQIAYFPGHDLYAESDFDGIWMDCLELTTDSGYFFYGSDIRDDSTWETYQWNEDTRLGVTYNNVEDNMWYKEVSYDQNPGPIIGMIDDEQNMDQGIMLYWLDYPELSQVSNWDSGTGVLGEYFPGYDIDCAAVHDSDSGPQSEGDFFYIVLHDEHANYKAVQYKRCVPNVEDDIEFAEDAAYLDGGETYDAQNPVVDSAGEQVIVVYMVNENGDWDIRCKYSNDHGTNWQTSSVADEPGVDEQYPAVSIIGGNILVAYVKNGNLFTVLSEDGGANWEDPIQINDEDGTVVAQENFIDIHKGGIVWVDNRNGDLDVYYSALIGEGVPPSNPTASYDKQNDELTVSATDPDGDQIRYGVSWNNDQNVDTWTEFADSGAEVKIDCEGRTGKVGVIAEDSTGLQSGWTSVTPKNKPLGLQILLSELFPQIYKLLQKLLQL